MNLWRRHQMLLFVGCLSWAALCIAIARDRYQYFDFLDRVSSPFPMPGDDPAQMRHDSDYVTPLVLAAIPLGTWSIGWIALRLRRIFQADITRAIRS